MSHLFVYAYSVFVYCTKNHTNKIIKHVLYNVASGKIENYALREFCNSKYCMLALHYFSKNDNNKSLNKLIFIIVTNQSLQPNLALNKLHES